jgi:hypothetical protein
VGKIADPSDATGAFKLGKSLIRVLGEAATTAANVTIAGVVDDEVQLWPVPGRLANVTDIDVTLTFSTTSSAKGLDPDSTVAGTCGAFVVIHILSKARGRRSTGIASTLPMTMTAPRRAARSSIFISAGSG